MQTTTLVAGAPYLAAYDFALSVMSSSFRAWIGSFDLYKVHRVKFEVVPQWNVSYSSDDLPMITMVANYDDVTNPVSVDSVAGTEGAMKLRRLTGPTGMWIVPRVIMPAALAAGGTQNAVTMPCPWLNTTATGVSLFGLKLGIQAVSALPAGGGFNIVFTYDYSVIQAFT